MLWIVVYPKDWFTYCVHFVGALAFKCNTMPQELSHESIRRDERRLNPSWPYKYYRNSQGDFLEMKKVYVAMSAELPQGSLPFWGTLVW